MCIRDSAPTVNRAGVRIKIPLGGAGVGLHDALRHCRWSGAWKAEVFKRLVPKGQPKFVDVGANTGQTLLEIFTIHPDASYVGFEPIPSCAAYVSSLIQANNWETAMVLASALGGDAGVVPLYRHSGSITDSSATVLRDLRPGLAFDVDWVPCLRFDSVRDALHLDDVDFIKIDVEGAELDVIKGMEETLTSIRPIILCEVLFTDPAADILVSTHRNEELMRRLTRHGYTVWQLIKSADLANVLSLRPVAEFPPDYWTTENAELCDYLFLPGERAQHLVW